MDEQNEGLSKEFHKALRTTYEEGIKRGYYPVYFMQMLEKYGGVETAKRLLSTKEVQKGLMRLYELNLLSSSMEAFVIKEKFRPLFSEEEIEEANSRLRDLDFFKDKT